MPLHTAHQGQHRGHPLPPPPAPAPLGNRAQPCPPALLSPPLPPKVPQGSGSEAQVTHEWEKPVKSPSGLGHLGSSGACLAPELASWGFPPERELSTALAAGWRQRADPRGPASEAARPALLLPRPPPPRPPGLLPRSPSRREEHRRSHKPLAQGPKLCPSGRGTMTSIVFMTCWAFRRST